ncbi:unnamed protein product [Peronospora destructor]|uniref:RxLR effector protein n=1 Tax=Peronospora destructor TaxID=86335 RepID=A0AAV0TB63_9STRA|nr:unnamed protein product [Peronospora destructor]
MVKALVLVTLLSWPATSVTIADVIPESIIPSSHALRILKVAPILTSIKRHLRSNAAITSIEELLNLAPTLKQILPPNKLEELEFLQRQQLSSSDLFTHLKLDRIDIHQLLQSPDFFAWVAIIIRYPKPYKEVLFEHQKIDDGSAATKLAERLLQEQVKSWGENHEKTSEEIFSLLHLHEAKGDLFESPAFLLWVDFVESSRKGSSREAYKFLYTVLLEYYKNDGALLKALVERLDINDDNLASAAARSLLNVQNEIWRGDGKTAEEVFMLLNLGETEDKLFESPALSVWVAFVKLSNPIGWDATSAMFLTLSGLYEESVLIKALVAGENIKATHQLAVALINSPLESIWKHHLDLFVNSEVDFLETHKLKGEEMSATATLMAQSGERRLM